MVCVDVKLATHDEVTEPLDGFVYGQEFPIKRAVLRLSVRKLLGEGDRLPSSVGELLKDGANPSVRRIRSNGDRGVEGGEGESGGVSKCLFNSNKGFVRCWSPLKCDRLAAFDRFDHRVEWLKQE